MPLPVAYAAALASDAPTLDVWLEVEGIPYALGLNDRAGAWFSGARRAACLGVLAAMPAGAEQEVRPLDGESSIGAMTAKVIDAEGAEVLQLVAGSQRRDGWLRLQADLPASAADIASLTVGGVADAALWADAGVFFLGRETFTYDGITRGPTTTTFTTVKRARYQLEGEVSLFLHVAGAVISPYPRFLQTRRVTIYASLDGTDAGRAPRWGGVVRRHPAIRGLAGFEIEMDSTLGGLKVRGFGTQRRGRLAVGIRDGRGGEVPATDPTYGYFAGSSTGSVLQIDPSTMSGASWVAGQRMLVRVDDEVFCVRMVVPTDPTAQDQAYRLVFDGGAPEGRGLLGTARAEHDPGAEVIELMWTGAATPNGPPEARTSQFSAGDHPLEVVLQLLLSRNGDGANGSWDTIKDGRGLGLDQAKVDVTGILSLRDRWLPGVRHQELIEEPFDFKELVASILRPCLCYAVTLADGRVSVRRMNGPVPGLTMRSVTAQDVVAPATWETDAARVFGRVIFRCDYDGDDYRQTFTGELEGPGVEAQSFYPGLFSTHTVESRGHFAGLTRGLDTGAADLAARLFEAVRDRYAQPPPVLGIECMYDVQDVDVGDLIRLTVDHVPNPFTGGRGLSDAVCEVLRRTVVDESCKVYLTVAQTDYATNARLLAPSAVLSAAPSGTTVTLLVAQFSAGNDAAAFRVGDTVGIYSPDMLTMRGTVASVTAVGVNAVTVSASTIAGAAVAGDVLTLVARATAGPAHPQMERCAYLAPTATAFADGAPAHEFTT